MSEILKITKEFKEIVITCRTQFFPTDKEIPNDTGYITFGGEQESYKFQRVYISVLDEKDIKKYLRKRFSFFQFSKRSKAFEIVKKSPNLVMRPMLLSYINDLVETNKTFIYSYEIYEILIQKWIERESRKNGVRQKYKTEENYQRKLHRFSQALAVNLYLKSKERGGYFINRDEMIKNPDGLQISDIDSYEMSETEVRSKSLLNRNADGQYKFSHKSILEYFLAKELLENNEFLSKFDFEGMSTAENFLNEMIEPLRKLKGEFSFEDEERKFPLKYLSASKICSIKNLKITDLKNVPLLNLSIFVNLKILTIFDLQKYYVLYELYELIFSSSEKFQPRDWMKLQRQLERIKLIELKEHLVQIKKNEKLNPVKNIELVALRRETNETFADLYRRQKKIRSLQEKGSEDLISIFQEIEDFLKNVKLLKKKLPNCKIWY